ncbi:MAG TPA: cupredoxin domain-containing protein [Dehalococcoidia bacterium]|nr:cupredoxin domain-containing protein [Dehalococcoidia bacterium]
MELIPGLWAGTPGVLAAAPAWLEALDGANLLIGSLILLMGLLGLAYLALAFVTTPQPRTEPSEPEAYPGVDRFLVPLALPLGVAFVIAAIITLMSQIMLVVPEAIATPIALAVALFILLSCALIANAPRVSRGLIYTIIGAPALVLVIAGGASGAYRINQAQEEAAAQAQREAGATTTSPGEVTTDNKFSKTTLNVPVGQEVTFTQTNAGLNTHNWHVLDIKDSGGKDVTTAVTQPGQKSTVTFTISAAGSYKFLCDVHPTEMIGQLNVKAAGS